MAIPKPGRVCWYNFLKVIFSVSSRFVNRVGKTQFWWWNKTVRLSWGFHWSRVSAITAGRAGSLEEKKIFKWDESPRSLGWKFTFLSSYRPLVHLKTSFSFFPHNSHLSIDIFSWQSQSLKSFSSLPVHNALCACLHLWCWHHVGSRHKPVCATHSCPAHGKDTDFCLLSISAVAWGGLSWVQMPWQFILIARVVKDIPSRVVEHEED